MPAEQTSPMASFKVYLISSAGMPRDHHSIFVETNYPVSGAGHIYQVAGNVQNGMVFEEKPCPTSPEKKDPTFISRVPIGSVAGKDYPDSFREICSNVVPPKKQFDGTKRLFPQEPLRRCQEWTAETIRKLSNAGIIMSEM